MKFQTDPKLMFNAKSDCYVFDVLKVHEIVGKHEFSYSDIKKLRKVSVRADFIGEDGYINAKGIQGLAAAASGISGVHVYIRRNSSNGLYNFIFARYQRRTNSLKLVTHFVLANFEKPLKKVDWDPWSESGSRTASEGNVVDFRYIWAEKI